MNSNMTIFLIKTNTNHTFRKGTYRSIELQEFENNELKWSSAFNFDLNTSI